MYYDLIAEMHCIVLFILFRLTQALVVHENVVFHKANDIAFIRSKWLSTFVIDVKLCVNL